MTATRQRSGAHRPRRRGAALVAPLLLAVVVVAAVLAGVRWLPSLDLTRAGGGSAASGTSTSAAPTAAASSGSATPSSTSTTAQSSSPEPAESAETVDRSVPVTVLNGTGRAGLATRVAATLRSAGWAVGGLGNLPEGAASSTVYYPQTQLRATARAVSEDLPGSQRVVRSSRFGSVVTVVLGPDYVG